MKWLDEVKYTRISELELNGNDSIVVDRFEAGFDLATKAISEKLREIDEEYSHGDFCDRYHGRCDCWKAKLKEIGLC